MVWQSSLLLGTCIEGMIARPYINMGSTKPELHVDVWSGNHPFYTGTQKIIDTEGRVERFLRKYGMADDTQTKTDSAEG